MQIIFIILNFIAGTFFGSFFNVIVLRSHRSEKWWGLARSECDTCHHVLNFFDLIPIASYTLFHGKCRYCGAKIGKSHLISEILAGVGFAVFSFIFIIDNLFTPLGIIVLYIVMLCILFNSISDLNFGYTYTIPIYASCLIVFGIKLYQIFSFGSTQELINTLLFTLAVAVIFIAAWFLLRKKMGGGDFDILFLIFLSSGIEGMLITVFCASVIGLCIVLPLLITKKMGRDTQIPFVPLIFAGYLIHTVLTLFSIQLL